MEDGEEGVGDTGNPNCKGRVAMGWAFKWLFVEEEKGVYIQVIFLFPFQFN